MAIGLTEEHEALREAVAGWAGRHVTTEAVREAVDAAQETRPGAWSSLADQGLLGLHLPERYGGQGYGLLELAVALEALGHALAPGPFLPTVLASAIVADSAETAGPENHKDLLTSLADGSRTAAAGLETGLTAEPVDGGYRLRGETGPVLGAVLADTLVLPARLAGAAGGEVWFAVDVDTAGVTTTPSKSIDLTRGVATVHVAEATVPGARLLEGVDRDRVRAVAAVLIGAEAAGVAGWCLETASGYARVREQFGRPIGQFQAVKHRCAEMLAAAEQARAAVWDAARAVSGGADDAGESTLAATVAGVLGPNAAVSCANDCIQVLGGIGYTWEHDAHLYLRRALTLRALLGASGEWATRASRLALSGTRRALTIDLPESAERARDDVRTVAAELAALESGERHERLASEGWIMPHLPGPWGRDAGPVDQLVIQQEFEAAGVKRPDLVIGAWVVPTLVQHGTPEQQQRFLPATLRGEITWCQLFSEPGAGSDLAALATRAERVEGGWQLTGQKIWTSLAHHADWAICLARTDTSAPKHAGITYFLVDMRSAGVEVRPLREITGDSMFNEVFLDAVFVPDECVVGEPGQGWRMARTTLANERVALSSGWSLGGLQPLLDLVGGLNGSGASEASGSAVLERTGELVCAEQALGLLGLRVTLMRLSGTEPGPTSSVRKLLGMRQVQAVVEYGWSLLGSQGVSTEGAGAYWSHMAIASRSMTIAGGTTEVQLNIIAERILGLPRDP